MRQALGRNPGRGLLLGVTPELARLTADIVAIDNNFGMISVIWPGGPVVQADWLCLPFRQNSFDFVIGDGSLTMLSYPEGYIKFFAQIKTALKPSARAVFRAFVTPETAELRQSVMDAAFAGKIGNFHAFKWRLAMALVAERKTPDIAVSDIYNAFQKEVPDRQKLVQATGWPKQDIDTIDVYRDSAAVYSFPTLSQLRQVVTAGWREQPLVHGSYELAERCPVLTFVNC